MVSSMRTKWLIKMAIKTQLRPSAAKTEWMLAAITTDETAPKLHAGPWHAIAQQFIFGMPNFRANLREPRPGARCNIERLASSRIPLLILIPRDETGQDGPRTADRYRQQLPHARVELVDDSNHIVFIDRTDVVTDRLKKFLVAR